MLSSARLGSGAVKTKLQHHRSHNMPASTTGLLCSSTCPACHIRLQKFHATNQFLQFVDVPIRWRCSSAHRGYGVARYQLCRFHAICVHSGPTVVAGSVFCLRGNANHRAGAGCQPGGWNFAAAQHVHVHQCLGHRRCRSTGCLAECARGCG